MCEHFENSPGATELNPGLAELVKGTNTYRLLMESVTDYAIFLLDPEGRVVTWNRLAEQLEGYEPDDIIGRNFSVFYPAEAVAGGGPQRELHFAAREGRFEDEGWRVRKDGTTFWAHVVTTALRDEQGNLIGYAKSTQDNTAKRNAVLDLKRSEAKFQRLFESAPDGVVVVDPSGIIVQANAEIERQFLRGRGEIIGQSVEILLPERLQERHSSHRSRYFEKPQMRSMGGELELLGLRSDGSEFRVDIMLSPLQVEDEVLALAVIRDVTERNKVVQELRQARSELEHRVAERTAELERANAELQVSKEAADSANLAKSEFLSRMSHELRTPLNAIMGFGQILALTHPSERDRQSIDHILKAGDHLLDLINEVLDISRVETGNMEFSMEPVMVAAVTSACLDLIRPLAASKNISVFDQTSGLSHHFVSADQQRLKQVFLNLASNAVKYGNAGGTLKVSCEIRGDMVRVAFADNGPGIALAEIPRLFVPFDRLGAEKSGVEGTGLGLALCKGMVEAMRGHIGVESIHGLGSTFFVDLPLAISQEQPVGQIRPFAEGESTLSEREVLVLAIEDNLSNYQLLQSILGLRPNVKLLCAMQGTIGLELARVHGPDVILLDVHLPDLLGNEVLARLKDNPRTAKIPVIVLSADATEKQIGRLLDGGAENYLTKPLNVQKLLAILDAIMGKNS